MEAQWGGGYCDHPLVSLTRSVKGYIVISIDLVMNVVFLCSLPIKMMSSSSCLHQDSIVLCPEEERILQNNLLNSTPLSLTLASSRLGLSLKTVVGIVFSSEYSVPLQFTCLQADSHLIGLWHALARFLHSTSCLGF